MVNVTLPLAKVKRQLAKLASFSMVFGFMVRVPMRYELINWINGFGVLGIKGAVEFINYLAKGFFTIKFNDQSAMTKVLAK